MKKLNEILNEPKTKFQMIVRGIIVLAGGCIGAVCLFFFMWFFWIILG